MHWTIGFRLAFWAALLFAVTMAVVPHPVDMGVEAGDKVNHILAFLTMTTLAVLAWPAAPLLRIGERLSFLGAMIEVVQSIPSLHRDCDILDWVADTAAIAVVLGLAWVWRRWRAGRG